MVKPKVSTVLWMMLVWMLPMPVMAEEAKKSPPPLAEMSVSSTRIDWAPAVEAQRWVLTLSGPDEFFLRRELKAGKALFLSIFDSEGDRLPDGSYTWELKAASKSPASPRRQSGSFSIQDGSFVEMPRDTGSGAPKPPLVLTTAEDSIETGNLIVQQNACIGDECSTTDANFSVLKLKSVHPNILFDGIELPEGGGGSPHDWALFVNHNDAAHFSIVDFTNNLIPFRVAAGAPDNSLYIAGNGNVSLGTSATAARLNVKANGPTAVARIHNSSATGPSGIEYLDNTGNVDLFFGIDNAASTTRLNSLNSNPILFLTNNTERMRVTPAGRVGIGTTAPGATLDIEANAAATESARVTNLSASGFSGFSYFDETGTNGLFIGLDNANNTTRINSVNSHPIVILTNGTERIRFPAPGGNVITAANGAVLNNAGQWVDSSSRDLKQDVIDLSSTEAAKTLRELNPVKFAYKAAPDEVQAGFIAEDVPELVGEKSRKGLSSLEIVAVLTKVVQEQQKTIDDLSARLAGMEALFSALKPRE